MRPIFPEDDLFEIASDRTDALAPTASSGADAEHEAWRSNGVLLPFARECCALLDAWRFGRLMCREEMEAVRAEQEKKKTVWGGGQT